MRSPVAGLTVALAAAAVVVLAPAAPAAAVPPAAATTAGAIAPLTPGEGELVVGDPELSWTEVLGTGYEVRWNTDGTRGVDGGLDAAAGGRAFPASASYLLADAVSPTYHWQVRALPAGDWSHVATFHVDIQLPTLDLPPVDETGTRGEPSAPAETPESEPPLLGGPFHGLVWVAAGSTFAGLLLAIVGRQWFRLRRAYWPRGSLRRRIE